MFKMDNPWSERLLESGWPWVKLDGLLRWFSSKWTVQGDNGRSFDPKWTLFYVKVDGNFNLSGRFRSFGPLDHPLFDFGTVLFRRPFKFKSCRSFSLIHDRPPLVWPIDHVRLDPVLGTFFCRNLWFMVFYRFWTTLNSFDLRLSFIIIISLNKV